LSITGWYFKTLLSALHDKILVYFEENRPQRFCIRQSLTSSPVTFANLKKVIEILLVVAKIYAK
jgi:hypothetical protein